MLEFIRKGTGYDFEIKSEGEVAFGDGAGKR
jgi:hypothetical protein